MAADNARFCEIFINIGAIVDYGGHYFLPRLVGLAKARELAMLGNKKLENPWRKHGNMPL